MNKTIIGALLLGAFTVGLNAAPVAGIGDNTVGVMGLYSNYSKHGVSTDGLGVAVGGTYSIMDEAQWGIEARASLGHTRYSTSYKGWGGYDYDFNGTTLVGGAIAYYKWKDDLKPFAGLNMFHTRISGDGVFGDGVFRDGDSWNDTDIGFIVGIEWKISEQWSLTPALVDNGIDSDLVVSTRFQLNDSWALDGTVNVTNDTNVIGVGVTTVW